MYNVKRGNVKHSRGSSEKLTIYNQVLRKFVYDKGNIARKRKFLIQKGGFLPLLFPAAIDTTARQISFAIDQFSKLEEELSLGTGVVNE